MPAVDSAYAQWLQSANRLTITSDLSNASKWNLLAQDLTASSIIAREADALIEAQRQLDFRSAPLAEEKIELPKLYQVAALRGRVWTIKIAGDAAYQNGADVFVLGGVADHGSGITTLTVLRKLST